MTAPISAAMMVPALHDDRYQYQQVGLNLLGRLVKYQFKMTVDDGFNAAGLAWAVTLALTLTLSLSLTLSLPQPLSLTLPLTLTPAP